MFLLKNNNNKIPLNFPINGRNILTTDQLFNIQKIPKNMIVVGGGLKIIYIFF